MKTKARKAYNIWRAQRARCYSNDKRNISWKKNKIKVEYTSREFIGWFLEETKHIDKWDGNKHNIGRINHKKNYTFNNILLQTKTENIKEMRQRTKKQRATKIYIYKKINDKLHKVVYGTIEAEEETGLDRSNIYLCLKENRKPRDNKYYFKCNKIIKTGGVLSGV